jgi:hypothetical protein
MGHIAFNQVTHTLIEPNRRLVRVSSLGDFRTSPRHWIHHQITPKEETPMMALGSQVHAALLEPAKFDETYYVAEETTLPETIEEIRDWIRARGGEPKGTKKEQVIEIARSIDPMFHTRSTWLAARQGARKLVSREDWEIIEKSVQSVHRHPFANKLMFNPEDQYRIEERMYADMPGIDFTLTGQPDMVNMSKRLCIEVKRSFATSAQAFAGHAYRMGYHVQAAAYTEMLSAVHGAPFGFVWVVIEANAPHSVSVFMPDDAMLDAGRLELKGIMSRLDTCLKDDRWPGPGGFEIETISLTSWQLQEALNAGPAEEFGV